jgi:ribose transport system substrate-binding protein
MRAKPRILTSTTLVLLLAGAAAVAGVARSSGAATHPAAATATQPGLARAQAQVARAMKVPPFQGPSQRIDVTALKGKTVWIIVNSLQNPFNTSIAKAAQDALKRAGIKTKLIDGKGQLNEWTRQIQEAVAQKADAIIDSGVPTDLVKGPLKDAAAAHIPLIEAVNDVSAPLFPGVKAHVAFLNKYIGETMAAYVIAKSGGKADVLFFTDPEFVTTVGKLTSSSLNYFKANCPECHVTVKKEQIATLATSVPNDTQTILRAKPNIKWVIAAFDYMGGFVVQGLQQGRLSGVGVIGADAVAQQLDQIRKGQYYVADIGATPIWSGWAAADLIMRLMAGKPAPKNEIVPPRLFTKENLPASNDPDVLFKTDFRTPYLKLWGLKK